MKKITSMNWRVLVAPVMFFGLALFMQADALAQCTPTPNFGEPPPGLVCPGAQMGAVIWEEDFNAGGGTFGAFTEDSPPGPGTVGSNDLTISTFSDTPSSGTGPECTANGSAGNTDEEFIFLEGSFTQAGETHCMTSSAIDLTTEVAPLALSFWYYMFGDNIGDLTVFVNGNLEFTASGQMQTGQEEDWLQGYIDLSAYAGMMITIQVCMTEGNGAISTFESDISVDHFQVFRCMNFPQIVCPGDIMEDNDPGECGGVVNFGDAVAFDVEDGPLPVTQTMGLPSGSFFDVGTHVIEFSATDSDGNTSTCQFTITINDAEPPTQFDCPADIVVDNDPGICGAVVNYPDPTLMDNCFSLMTTPGSLTTLFASNNSGSFGGAVYFDVTVGPDPITVNELDVNTAELGAFTLEVYTILGTSVGNETNMGLWTLASTGSGTSAGDDNPSNAVLDTPFGLDAGTLYGMAVVFTSAHGHDYTNGNGGNENYSNGEITLDLGGASNVPFSGSIFSPRVFNGTLYYDVGTSSVPYTVVTGFPSGSVFPVGTTLTTLEYMDSGGNTVQCTFDVTVNDVEAPTVMCEGAPGTYDMTITITEPALAGSNLFSFPGTPVGAVGDATLEVRTFGDIDGALGGGNEEAWTITDEDAATVGVIGGTGDFGDQCNTTLMETFIIPAASIDAWAGDGMIDFSGDDLAGNINVSLCGGDFLELRLTYNTAGAAPVDVVLDANGMASITAASLLNSANDNCGVVTVVGPSGAPVPMSLQTTLAGGNGNFGNMFDVNALSGVTMQSFDIHGDTGAVFDVEVWAKSGTHVGFEDDMGAWTLIGTAPGVVSNGDGVVTPLNLMLGYVMGPGETHAFYVTPTDTSTGGFNYTNGTAVGNVFASDANIEFLEGSGKPYPFTGTTFAPRVFNGNLVYDAGGALSTTLDFTCDDVGIQTIPITAIDAAGNETTCDAQVNVIDDTDPIIICYGEDESTDLISNGSFESGDFSGWTVIDFANPFVPWNVAASAAHGFGMTPAFPTDGGLLAANGFDGDGPDESVVYQDVTIPMGAMSATLSWDENIEYDLSTFCAGCSDRIYEVQVRDLSDNVLEVVQQVTAVGGTQDFDGVWDSLSADLLAYAGQTVRIAFWQQIPESFTGPAQFALDNVRLDVMANFPPATIELGPDGTAEVDELALLASVNEACGIATSASDIIEVTCDDIAISPIDIMVFVADPSGNIAACVATVNVVDLLPPEVTCPADQTVDPGPGMLFYPVPDYVANGDASATDNCTDPVTIFTQDPAPGTLLPDGVYTVTICATDEYGNEGCCTFELTVETTLGVNDNELSNAIAMYPNPAQEQVTISNGSNILLDSAAIYDLNGKLINTIDLSNMQQEKVIDVSSLSSGVYMVQITGDNASVVKRLIKE